MTAFVDQEFAPPGWSKRHLHSAKAYHMGLSVQFDQDDPLTTDHAMLSSHSAVLS